MRVYILGERIPYARVILRVLRDKNTPVQVFREWLRRAGALLGASLYGSLDLREVTVDTPLGRTVELSPASLPLIVNVLGAGEFLAQGILDALPGAPLGFVAARRVEEGPSTRTELHYVRLPPRVEGPAVVADPMLATGGTVEAVSRLLFARGASRVIVASVIAAPEGLRRLEALDGEIHVYLLALDAGLDDRNFIVPGLGDAGDRSLGVVP